MMMIGLIWFVVGFALGIFTTCYLIITCSWLIYERRIYERRCCDQKLEERVDLLYGKLTCGGGMLGCSGGPHCTSDHK